MCNIICVFYAAIKLLLTYRSIYNSFIWSCKSVCMMLTQYVNITPLLKFVSHIVCTATVYSDDCWSQIRLNIRSLKWSSFLVTLCVYYIKGKWKAEINKINSMSNTSIFIDSSRLHVLTLTGSSSGLLFETTLKCCIHYWDPINVYKYYGGHYVYVRLYT
jgi:hypothetical protein